MDRLLQRGEPSVHNVVPMKYEINRQEVVEAQSIRLSPRLRDLDYRSKVLT